VPCQIKSALQRVKQRKEHIAKPDAGSIGFDPLNPF